MVFFSGVRFPVMILPIWGKILSLFFPLTYALGVLRGIFSSDGFVVFDIILMLIVNGTLIVVTGVLVKYVEKKFRRTGEFNLY